MTLIDQINAQRTAKQLTIRTVADRLGWPYDTARKKLASQRGTTTDELEQLAAAVGLGVRLVPQRRRPESS